MECNETGAGSIYWSEVPFERNLSRRRLLSALAAFPAARLLSGQDKPTTFSTDVKLVNILATVRDKKGKIVSNLSQNDFLLDEDGKQQTIKFFSRESNLPLTIGLMVDTSGSQRNVLASERTASYQFFDQILREDRDLAFVIHFDFDVELLQDLTPSRQKLEKALDLLQVGERPQNQQQQSGPYPGGGQQGGQYPGGGGGGGYPYPGGRRYPGGGGRRYPGGRGGGRYPGGGRRGGGGGTKLYDAILLAGDELMKKQKGRKALVLLTDGVDHGSKSTIFQAIESAQRSDTVVYSVLFADSRGFGMQGGADGKKVLEQIAKETGGGFFEVGRSHPIEKVFATVEEELRNQYSIGYTPDQPNPNGVYRHIHLTAKGKGLVVQAREGYYPA